MDTLVADPQRSIRPPRVTRISLLAPCDGWALPITDIPDPVFSAAMLGNGIAIDPSSAVLCAPCPGVVTMIHHAHHALTLAVQDGPDILMHIGLETLSLNGEGFEVHVAEGQAVAAGDRLISFGLDLLARRAASLISPIIVTGADWAVLHQTVGRLVHQGEVIMEIALLAPAAESGVAAGPVPAAYALRPVPPRQVVVQAEGGIHARPAGLIANCAGNFAADISLAAHGRQANARSPTSVMALGVQQGDAVTVAATGEDAAAAVGALCEMLAKLGAGAPATGTVAAPQATVTAPVLSRPSEFLLHGVAAAPGTAVGRTLRLVRQRLEVTEAGAGAAVEQARLAAALEATQTDMLGRIRAAGASPDAEILRAHLAFLRDPDLASASDAFVQAGKSAGFAWRSVVDREVATLEGSGVARIAERADDLRDVARLVLLRLAGRTEIAPELPPRTILIEDDLLPSQLTGLDLSRVAGICTASGGPTSHVAILAASHGIPALVAIGPALLEIADGTTVLLDAGAGTCRIDPSPALLRDAEAKMAAGSAAAAALRAQASKPCQMADGTPIALVANLGGLADVALALANGAEGCGLLRTEFLFLGQQAAPSEDEQHAAYQAIASALGGRTLIIRTLDPGADKVLPYLAMPLEANPSLGLRGIRMSLWRPEILHTQLRAILRVEPPGQCLIMLPMVATLDELRQVRRVLDAEKAALGRTDGVKLGIMVEVPSAALMADLLGREADFFSIGTNDLTQYTLAMDRTNPNLAKQVDAFHPAVLRLIAMAAQGAAAHGGWTGVCGGLASTPMAAPVLIGLGVTELSATPAAIPRVKALVAGLTMQTCRDVAKQALAQPSAEAVRSLLARLWPDA